MLNSFGSCISNASEEFSWAPKMSMSEILSQPGMLLHQLKGRVAFKQLQGFANRNCWRQFNKQMDMVNCNLQFVDFASMFQGNLSDKSLTINFNPIKLEGVHGIFAFPYKMESILPEGVFKILQIHFFAPKLARTSRAHANFFNLVQEGNIYPLYANKHQELNIEDGNSSHCLKAGVSLPLM